MPASRLDKTQQRCCSSTRIRSSFAVQDCMGRTLFCLLMLCMSATPTVAAQRSPQMAACRDHRQALRDALADIQRRQRNIGLSALIMLGGETVVAENLGYADLEHRVPVTNETRFGVASITKAFTGALTSQAPRSRASRSRRADSTLRSRISCKTRRSHHAEALGGAPGGHTPLGAGEE